MAERIDVLAHRGKGVVRLGVPETAKSAVAAALAARHHGPALVVVPSASRANALHDELALYLEDVPLARLPERETLPYELVPDNRAPVADRSHALTLLRSEDRALVVASWAALSEHCAPPAAVTGGVNVAMGGSQGPGALARALEEEGYIAATVADQPGTFVRRGGIVDVFGVGAEGPVRIEFFGDEVDSIRTVDVASQRSVARINAVSFAPVLTSTRAAQDAAAALRDAISGESDAADVVREQLELIAAGERSSYNAFFEPLLSESTALDYLADTTLLLFDDAEDGAANLEKAWEYDARTRTELEQRGALPAGLPPLRAEPGAFARNLHVRRETVHLLRFGTDESGARRLPLNAAPGFAGKLRALV
jgi:transcription-repair coupling factor (superfamily II helicase)